MNFNDLRHRPPVPRDTIVRYRVHGPARSVLHDALRGRGWVEGADDTDWHFLWTDPSWANANMSADDGGLLAPWVAPSTNAMMRRSEGDEEGSPFGHSQQSPTTSSLAGGLFSSVTPTLAASEQLAMGEEAEHREGKGASLLPFSSNSFSRGGGGPFRHVNHFAGADELVRYDLAVRHYKRTRRLLEDAGYEEEADAFDFFLPTYAVPSDWAALERAFRAPEKVRVPKAAMAAAAAVMRWGAGSPLNPLHSLLSVVGPQAQARTQVTAAKVGGAADGGPLTGEAAAGGGVFPPLSDVDTWAAPRDGGPSAAGGGGGGDTNNNGASRQQRAPLTAATATAAVPELLVPTSSNPFHPNVWILKAPPGAASGAGAAAALPMGALATRPTSPLFSKMSQFVEWRRDFKFREAQREAVVAAAREAAAAAAAAAAGGVPPSPPPPSATDGGAGSGSGSSVAPIAGAASSAAALLRAADEAAPPPPHVAQRYVDSPHLIGGKKYDLCVYVLVTDFSSPDPRAAPLDNPLSLGTAGEGAGGAGDAREGEREGTEGHTSATDAAFFDNMSVSSGGGVGGGAPRSAAVSSVHGVSPASYSAAADGAVAAPHHPHPPGAAPAAEGAAVPMGRAHAVAAAAAAAAAGGGSSLSTAPSFQPRPPPAAAAAEALRANDDDGFPPPRPINPMHFSGTDGFHIFGGRGGPTVPSPAPAASARGGGVAGGGNNNNSIADASMIMARSINANLSIADSEAASFSYRGGGGGVGGGSEQSAATNAAGKSKTTTSASPPAAQSDPLLAGLGRGEGLTIWIYRSGYARFCTRRFTLQTSDLGETACHFPAAQPQRTAPRYGPQTGCKWSLRSLRQYLGASYGEEVTHGLFESIQNAIIRALQSVHRAIPTSGVPHRSRSELYAFNFVIQHMIALPAAPSASSASGGGAALSSLVGGASEGSVSSWGLGSGAIPSLNATSASSNIGGVAAAASGSSSNIAAVAPTAAASAGGLPRHVLRPLIVSIDNAPSFATETLAEYHLKYNLVSDYLSVIDLEGRRDLDAIAVGGFDMVWRNGPIGIALNDPAATPFQSFIGCGNEHAVPVTKLPVPQKVWAGDGERPLI